MSVASNESKWENATILLGKNGKFRKQNSLILFKSQNNKLIIQFIYSVEIY